MPIVGAVPATPKQQLIEMLVPDIHTIIADARQTGESWRDIADRVNQLLPAAAAVTHETLRTWQTPNV